MFTRYFTRLIYTEYRELFELGRTIITFLVKPHKSPIVEVDRKPYLYFTSEEGKILRQSKVSQLRKQK